MTHSQKTSSNVGRFGSVHQGLATIRSRYGVPRLTVELIPRSTWSLNLRALLRQRDWNLLRRRTYVVAGHRCEICDGVGRQHPVECHERWEFDDGRSIQHLRGLIALCPACHAAKHFGRALAKGIGAEVLAHLAEVNSWSHKKAERYTEHELAIWALRSEKEWDLDLTWLKQLNVRPSAVAWAATCRRWANGRIE